MNEAAFLTDLKVLDITEGRDTRTLMLEEPFSVYSGVLNAVVMVPKGFICDGESIPAAIQWLVPPFGLSKRAAIVHDYLYRNAGYYNSAKTFTGVSRADADAVYHELCRVKGLPAWRASLRYRVLRLVGFAAWNSNRKQHYA